MGVSAPVAGKRNRKTVLNPYRVSRETGIPLATVQNWVAAGMPLESPGREAWIADHREKQRNRRGDGSLVEQKIAEEIAVLKERKLTARQERRRRKGLLVERVAVQRQWKRKVTEAKVQIEAIPALVAQFLPEGEIRSVVFEEVTKVVNRTLKGLARGKSAELEP